MMHSRMLVTTAMVLACTSTANGSSLHISVREAGARPEHRLTFELRAGDGEILTAEIVYPSAFRFLGFPTGAAQIPVGAYELDLDFDGAPERRLPLLALGRDSAFIDLDGDGRFAGAVDPLLEWRGGAAFGLRLPNGGDADAGTTVIRFDARVTLVFFPGLLMNPPLAGRYQVHVRLWTVDPDTGGSSDGTGSAPSVTRVHFPLVIQGQALVPFRQLEIDLFDLRGDASGRHSFRVHGWFAARSGIRFGHEDVTVSLDWVSPGTNAPRRWFVQTIAGPSFEGRTFVGARTFQSH
jgi:hypothetical protein